MNYLLTVMIAILLTGCGSTIDPMAGSGPFLVASSGVKSIVLYESKSKEALLRIERGLLIGGHVSILLVGNDEENYQYVGVLGQDKSGNYSITTPSTLYYLHPFIDFDKELNEVEFSWSDYEGNRYDVKLYRKKKEMPNKAVMDNSASLRATP